MVHTVIVSCFFFFFYCVFCKNHIDGLTWDFLKTRGPFLDLHCMGTMLFEVIGGEPQFGIQLLNSGGDIPWNTWFFHLGDPYTCLLFCDLGFRV